MLEQVVPLAWPLQEGIQTCICLHCTEYMYESAVKLLKVQASYTHWSYSSFALPPKQYAVLTEATLQEVAFMVLFGLQTNISSLCS